MTEVHASIRDAFQAGDLSRAAAMARRYLRGHQEDGRAWELAGQIHFAAGRFHRAVATLETASSLVPLTAEGRVALAQAYGQIEKRELAIDLLALLVEEKSLSAPLLLHVGKGLNHLDQPMMAMHACRAATERDPDLAQAYYDMGVYGTRCGVHPGHVEALIRKGVGLAPDNPRFRIGLASHLVQQGRTIDAYAAIRKLTDQQIDSVTCECCLVRMAAIYEQMGDTPRLRRCRQNLGHSAS